jgi:hypothetical protein
MVFTTLGINWMHFKPQYLLHNIPEKGDVTVFMRFICCTVPDTELVNKY